MIGTKLIIGISCSLLNAAHSLYKNVFFSNISRNVDWNTYFDNLYLFFGKFTRVVISTILDQIAKTIQYILCKFWGGGKHCTLFG